MKHYLPVFIAAASILVMGCWNPKILQTKNHGVPTGCPNWLWLALIALISGSATVALMHGKMEGFGGFAY